MLNDYMWNLYLQAGGKDIVEMFRRNLGKELTQEFADSIRNFHRIYMPNKKELDDETEQLKDVIDYLKENPFKNSIEETIDDSEKHIDDRQNPEDTTINWSEITKEELSGIYSALSCNGEYNEKETFENFSGNLAYYSTIFSVSYPDLFVPYFFQFNFNVLQSIANEFEIELPPLPIKKDYKGRFFYYGEVCNALKNFQYDNNLDDYELCAFLYDFAPKYIGGTDSYIINIDKLPEAKSVFFIGSSPKDPFYTEDSNAITVWQCNPDTCAGDMIVMYLRTPVSAICSVWRSQSVGFNDPFFYYYRCTYIGNPVQINPVTLDILRKDKILSSMPIVRKNMQGVDGVELKPSEYNRILDLAKSGIPRLQFETPDNDSEYKLEKDVERQLVKPLLKQLNYGESDYVQQLYIEIGNHNHALIPDFVLLPQKVKGRYNAFAIIEAKLSITNEKQLEETITQARSYAKLLGTKYQLIASKEKLWLFSEKDDYAKAIFDARWHELKNADTFSELYKLVGNK